MKEMTPFQKALLEAGNRQFSHIPEDRDTENAEELRPVAGRIQKKVRKLRVMRVALIAAALTVVLTGSVFAAVRFYLGGQVEKSIYSIPEYNATNQKYDLSFQQEIAAPDAPDYIREFMMPTILVGKEDVRKPNCFWEDGKNVWYPCAVDLGVVDHLEGKVRDVHTVWNYGDAEISLTQWTAASVQPGEPVISFHFDAEAPIKVSYDTFVLDQYEIFCFQWDYSELVDAEETEQYNYSQWFWTDGNYLYRLSMPGILTQEEQQALFESLAPVEDIYDYLPIEE